MSALTDADILAIEAADEERMLRLRALQDIICLRRAVEDLAHAICNVSSGAAIAALQAELRRVLGALDRARAFARAADRDTLPPT